jgi:hypothetical protein
MELTITQNGALYALQHGASKKYRSARRKRAIANKIIRTDELRLESLAGSMFSRPKEGAPFHPAGIIFSILRALVVVFVWTKLNLHL